MRITIDVDANELRQIQRITGQKKKSPAIAQALSEFVRQRQRQKFIARVLSGGTDYPLTNEQLEAQDVYESR
jgi:Arc/MetJ family transcription regulator